MHLRLVLTYLFWNIFNTEKHFALALKKIVHLLFFVFQTKLNKAVSIFCRLPQWIRNVQMIPGISTRLWWEPGWKSCMANSEDWRSKNVNVIELNCKVVKKVATSPFLHRLLLVKFIPFRAKIFFYLKGYKFVPEPTSKNWLYWLSTVRGFG